MNKDIFISYSSKDEEIAFNVCSIIEKTGIQCWIAPRNVRPGYSYDEEIVEGIETTKAIIVLVSANSNESDHVKRELELAINEGLRIYPIRIQNIEVGKKLKFFLAGKQWIDVFQPPFEEKLKGLIQVISDSFEIKSDSLLADKNISENPIIKTKVDKPSNSIQIKEQVKIEPKIDALFDNFYDERDGHTYKTVKIGKQIWMAENLVFKTSDSVYYKNDPKIGAIYGCLYTWDDAFNACPEGWKIPNEFDWYQFVNYVGDSEAAGKKIKVTGTEHWKPPYIGEDNSIGFSALPGGMRVDNTFGYLGLRANFWSSDEYDKNDAWVWSIKMNIIYRVCIEKNVYVSIRCIRYE